jgi:hypothetical protein
MITKMKHRFFANRLPCFRSFLRTYPHCEWSRIDNTHPVNKQKLFNRVSSLTVSSIIIPQLATFLLLGAFVVEKLVFAVTRAADGYEDDSGFHLNEPYDAIVILPLVVVPV